VTLCGRFGRPPPAADAIHWMADLGPFRLRWERHSEFTSYAFFVRGLEPRPFAEPAIRAVPAEWLQETVEGLSIAAITYYLVGLVGYVARALRAGGLAVDPDLAMGVSLPFIAVLVALGLRYVRRSLARAREA
jgi:uncharacterized membrane-anchored protein